MRERASGVLSRVADVRPSIFSPLARSVSSLTQPADLFFFAEMLALSVQIHLFNV